MSYLTKHYEIAQRTNYKHEITEILTWTYESFRVAILRRKFKSII